MITGNGQASKEQVADMLQRMLHIPKEEMPSLWMQPTDVSGRLPPFSADGTSGGGKGV